MTSITPPYTQAQQTNQSYNSTTYDDEIDLFELFQSLWREKVLIALVTAVITVVALLYALTATPIYQVQSIVKPAAMKDLDELNGSGIYKLSPEQALVQVGASLESYETRLGYFKANQNLFEPLLSDNASVEQNFERINRANIKILKTDAARDEGFAKHVGIQLQYPKGMNGAAIANGFIEHAIQLEKERIATSLEVVINNRLERLERTISNARAGYAASKEAQIAQLTEQDVLKKAKLTDELEALREELKVRRQNRIMQLDEAIAIAQSLGIKKPATPSSLAAETRSSGNVIRTEVNNKQHPLYFMGTETLNAERNSLLARENDDFTSGRIVEITTALKLLENNRQIEVLQSRENDDLFLAELAENRKEVARLKNLKVDLDNLKIVRIDQSAIDPTSPIKPQKSLIVAVGIVLGGMLGIFAALIRSMVRKRNKTNASQSIAISTRETVAVHAHSNELQTSSS